MNPILTLLSDGKAYHQKQLAQHMATEFSLSSEEQAQTSSKWAEQSFNRVTWACVELGADMISIENGTATIADKRRC